MKCESCGGMLAGSLCDPNWTLRKDINTNVSTASVINYNITMDSWVLLQTFRAFVVGHRATSYFWGVIDGGSHRTFIHTDASRKLNLEVSITTIQLNTFGPTTQPG